jgi:hypothetical protein
MMAMTPPIQDPDLDMVEEKTAGNQRILLPGGWESAVEIVGGPPPQLT